MSVTRVFLYFGRCQPTPWRRAMISPAGAGWQLKRSLKGGYDEGATGGPRLRVRFGQVQSGGLFGLFLGRGARAFLEQGFGVDDGLFGLGTLGQDVLAARLTLGF